MEKHLADGSVQYLDVQVAPIFDNGGGPLGVSITFADVTEYYRLHEELERSKHDLETAYGELQSTNEELQTTNEELRQVLSNLLSNRNVTLHMLRRLGYGADSITTGIEALESLERQPYDIVLMDVRMPQMNGLEATRAIPQALSSRQAAKDHSSDGLRSGRRQGEMP